MRKYLKTNLWSFNQSSKSTRIFYRFGNEKSTCSQLDSTQNFIDLSVHTLKSMLYATHICIVTNDRHQKKIYFLCFFPCHSPANTLMKKNFMCRTYVWAPFRGILDFFPLLLSTLKQENWTATQKFPLLFTFFMSYISFRYVTQTVFLTRFVTELLKIDFRLSHSLVFFGMNFN